MKRKLLSLVFAGVIFTTTAANAQVGVGTTTPEAALDVVSATNGMLVPRVALTAKNASAPVINPQAGAVANGTLVWNTNTAGVAPNNVVPGFYYWMGTAWNEVGNGVKNQWSLTGNSGTTPGTNFIGTTDNQDLRLRTGGTDRFNISNTLGQITSYSTGSVNGPTYSWTGTGNTNTGIFLPSTSTIGFATGGTEKFRIPNANQVHAMSGGSAALPFYSFNGNTTTGLWSAGANILNASTAGAERMRLLANGQIGINNTAPPATNQFTVTASAATGYGIGGYSSVAAGRGTFGVATGNGGDGVFGSGNSASGTAYFGFNYFANGTGIMVAGNNSASASYLAAGSGGAFTGYTTGVYGYYTTPGNGQAALFQDAYAGQWAIGAYNGSYYKIIGNGTVSTIVKDLNEDNVVMHATETPQNLFEDYGAGKLLNGKATIQIDPIFSKNIVVDEKHPLKVFVQLEGDCKGVYVTNKSAASFDVVEVQEGNSNVSFTYSVVAQRANERYISDTGEIRNVNYDLRFEKAPELQKKELRKPESR